jgi:hypothetical protein
MAGIRRTYDRRHGRATLTLGLAILALVALAAQSGAPNPFGQLGAPFRIPVYNAEPGSYNGGFRFCRISFRTSRSGDGDGWYVDYPRADENLSIRLAELTKTQVTNDLEGNPIHLIVRLTDRELFDCPFAMMTEPGGAFLDDEEAKQLRNYLLKGGFLWVDDFWGSIAWEWWAGQIGKVLPPRDYPIKDIPVDHPMLRTLFEIKSVPQIPNVGLWLRARATSERGRDSAEPHMRGIADSTGRVMVLMTHNTDFGDAYERESLSPDYFHRFSVPGYAIAIDILLYAMTH